MNYNELKNEQANFKAVGVIKDVVVDLNKSSKKSSWTGAEAVITFEVNGIKQKIRTMGGTGDYEFAVRAYKMGADNKTLKDENGKSIQVMIKPDDYDESKHFVPQDNKREIVEWENRERITHCSELTDSRFVMRLNEMKDTLMNRHVMLKGRVQFKPTQKFDKIEANMELSSITLLKVDEERPAKEHFLIETPIIFDKSNVKEINEENGLSVFVPTYQKYVTPIKRDGKEIKGRRVFVNMNLNINENGFMAMSKDSGFDMEDRIEILDKKVELNSEGEDLAIMSAYLIYRSGYISRQIDINDLIDDEAYGTIVKKALAMEEGEARDNKINGIIESYRSLHPKTVKGEFKQNVEFMSTVQNDEGKDKISGMPSDEFEKTNLEKMQEEAEQIEASKGKGNSPTTSKPAPTAKGKTVNTNIAEPVSNKQDFMNDDDFPF